MHRSRVQGFSIDCQDGDVDESAAFWGSALGMAPQEGSGAYRALDSGSCGVDLAVQKVSHASRVHLDVESDDVEAEVRRLEALGAMRIAKTQSWWVMEAPTGHRFCVCDAKRSLAGVAGATEWP